MIEEKLKRISGWAKVGCRRSVQLVTVASELLTFLGAILSYLDLLTHDILKKPKLSTKKYHFRIAIMAVNV